LPGKTKELAKPVADSGNLLLDGEFNPPPPPPERNRAPYSDHGALYFCRADLPVEVAVQFQYPNYFLCVKATIFGIMVKLRNLPQRVFGNTIVGKSGTTPENID